LNEGWSWARSNLNHNLAESVELTRIIHESGW
jgi:hypothetical protein